MAFIQLGKAVEALQKTKELLEVKELKQLNKHEMIALITLLMSNHWEKDNIWIVEALLKKLS